MSTTQIGAQLYTLREHCKTAPDFARTCARLAKMGYQAVQCSAVGPIPTEELAKILRDHGLACAATHQSLDAMKDTNKCLDYHQALGCQYTAIGGYWNEDCSLKTFTDFSRQFTEVAATLKARGLAVGYHNHSRELAHVSDAPKRILDVLLEQCGPEVWFEIDTYWIAHGGGDPAAWIAKAGGRCPCIHVKDMAVSVKQEQSMCEVGSGNLNWPAILAASATAGVRWYLVERDNGKLDPFDSLEISLKNMKQMGLR